MRRCSTFLVIKEAQIKTPLRFYLTPVRTLSSRMQATNAGEDVGEGTLFTAGRNANWCSYC
jgi:hypothetical protein